MMPARDRTSESTNRAADGPGPGREPNHPAPTDNFRAPHRPSVDEYAHCPAQQQQQQHDAWTTGLGFGNHAESRPTDSPAHDPRAADRGEAPIGPGREPSSSHTTGPQS